MLNRTHIGDCRTLLAEFAAAGVRAQTCVTSPPYFGLRDYGNSAQIGLESSPTEYVSQMVAVFRLVRDVLADDGTLWLNLGDSYASGGFGKQGASGQMANRTVAKARAGNPDKNGGASNRNGVINAGVAPKNLLGIPWRVAFALQADGWYLRSDIIWHKPNPMPESVTDRPTKAHEYLFLLAKSDRYYYDAESIKEPAEFPGGPGNVRANKGAGEPGFEIRDNLHNIGPREMRNRRTVWSITTKPFSGAHFATFPRDLVEPCIVAGSRPGDVVLDPFMGSGTTAQVSTDLGRQFIGCELNPKYVELHEMRRTTTGMAI
jgi:DNA modification methylase